MLALVTCERSFLKLAVRCAMLRPRQQQALRATQHFANSTNYLINTEHGDIVDVESTPAHRTAKVESTRTMIDRAEEQFDIKPEHLIGDTAYGTTPMLAWILEEKDIEPTCAVWDKTERNNDSFSSSDFRWNEEAEEYRCPAGNALRSEW